MTSQDLGTLGDTAAHVHRDPRAQLQWETMRMLAPGVPHVRSLEWNGAQLAGGGGGAGGAPPPAPGGWRNGQDRQAGGDRRGGSVRKRQGPKPSKWVQWQLPFSGDVASSSDTEVRTQPRTKPEQGEERFLAARGRGLLLSRLRMSGALFPAWWPCGDRPSEPVFFLFHFFFP